MVQADEKAGWHWKNMLPRSPYKIKKKYEADWGGAGWITSNVSRARIRKEVRPGNLVVCYQADPDQAVLGFAHVAKGGHTRGRSKVVASFDMDWSVRTPPLPWSAFLSDPILSKSEKAKVRVGTVLRLSLEELERILILVEGTQVQKDELRAALGLRSAPPSAGGLLRALEVHLREDGWTDIEAKGDVLRARRGPRRTLFGAVHVDDQSVKNDVRHATIRCLEARFEHGGGDALALASDGPLGPAERGLLESAGITWIQLVPPAEDGHQHVGLGKDTRPPKGKKIVLPRGTQITRIRGAKGPRAPGPIVGSGAGYVDLDLEFEVNARAILTFPAGFVMISKATNLQNGILVQVVTIALSRARRSFRLRMYCANQTRDLPTAGADYEFGVVVETPGLRQLFDLLAGKRIDEPSSKLVQDAVWAITDGDGLDAETRKKLIELPS